MILVIASWIAVGLLAGLIASKFVNLHGDDPRLGIAVAAGAAIVAGILYSVISGAGASAWNTWGVLAAAVGGIAGAVTWHLVRSRSISHSGYTSRRSY